MTSAPSAPSADAAGPRLALVDLAADDPRWDAALPVLQALRPHLTADLLRQVLADDAPGPRFLAAFDGDACLGVAGWRVIANTSAVRKLYVDDLVTAPQARSRGVGAALLAELERRARDAGCAVLDLDSGVQRFDAHRFYLRERMSITSHHFAKPL
ncbi:GNAT family N-acetyltransferase [Cellulosimicrobium sp. CUA-896]|nr:GNAT family N-acetyltransferase [Cellulosimicrobium sp. CUA-896]